MEAALLAVSFDHRAVLLLREVEGLSCEEIAATLGLPVGTVKSRLARARDSLRRALAPPAERRGHELPSGPSAGFPSIATSALLAADAREVSAHLEACRAVRGRVALLQRRPRPAGARCRALEATGEIAARVFDRLDMERRQPGLALVFRPFGAARPLILPSLVPAALRARGHR